MLPVSIFEFSLVNSTSFYNSTTSIYECRYICYGTNSSLYPEQKILAERVILAYFQPQELSNISPSSIEEFYKKDQVDLLDNNRFCHYWHLVYKTPGHE